MSKYFGLQLKILNRHFIDFGLKPLIAYCILLPGFAGLSVYLFSKTEFAVFIYIGIALSIIMKLSERNRNDFLKNIFPIDKYYKIRILENLVTILPFLIFLIFKQLFYPILLLLTLAVSLIFLKPGKEFTFTIPTPFYKKPFEFIVGFRKAIFFFFFSYFLTMMAILYQNFNLGIFSLILVFLICFSFYTEAENEFYVWVHTLNPARFLFDKIKTAIFFSTLLCLPITISLVIFFNNSIDIIIAFQVIGYIYLTTIILAKYSTYPDNMNLPQAVLIALSLSLPPILIGVIPFFYLQSIKRLKEILE